MLHIWYYSNYNKRTSSKMTSKSAPTERYTPPPENSRRLFLIERASLRNAFFSSLLIPDLSRDWISANRSSKTFDAGVGSPGVPLFDDIGVDAVVALDSKGLNVNNKHAVNRLIVIFFMPFIFLILKLTCYYDKILMPFATHLKSGFFATVWGIGGATGEGMFEGKLISHDVILMLERTSPIV